MKFEKLLATCILLVCTLLINAQTPQPFVIDNNNSVDMGQTLRDVIENLDKSDIDTDILYDCGWKLANMNGFDGNLSADTIDSHAQWLRQYGSLVTAYIGSGTSSAVPSINMWKNDRDTSFNSGKNPLLISHIEYHQFLEDSVLLSSLIYEQNGLLYDHSVQTTSPYEKKTLFSFTPFQSTIYDELSVSFELSSIFFRSNYTSTVTSVEIDFDNAGGYQSINLNGLTSVSWNSYGEKILKLKIAYANSEVFYGFTRINLINTTGAPAQTKYNSINDAAIQIQHPTDTEFKANLQIEYGCGNNKLVKPFIYVEGFSPEQFQPNLTYFNYYNALTDYQDDDYPLTGYKLLDELEENGYDIVYVDLVNSLGDITKNGELFSEVLRWVNQQKDINGSSEPNVVVGFSMGGLVARLGIKYIEEDSVDPDPQVSYYISVDSPHLGANIPYALSVAVDDLYNLSYLSENLGEYEEDLADAYDVLHSTAAKQMLIYGVPFGNSTRANFRNHLDQKGFPTSTIENISIAKGNGTSVGQGFPTLHEIMNVDIQTNYSCFDDLVDVFNLVDIDGGVGFNPVELSINVMLGILIETLTVLGVNADIDMDVNALPGHTSEPFEGKHPSKYT